MTSGENPQPKAHPQDIAGVVGRVGDDEVLVYVPSGTRSMLRGGERCVIAWFAIEPSTDEPPSCPNEPHERGLFYNTERDVMVCPMCGHEQYEEMGG